MKSPANKPAKRRRPRASGQPSAHGAAAPSPVANSTRGGRKAGDTANASAKSGAGAKSSARPQPKQPFARIKAGHVLPVWSGHPWVFAQAIAEIGGQPAAGDSLDVLDPKDQLLGRGLYSPNSAIPIRLFVREDQPIDAALLQRRIDKAIERRRDLGLPSSETTAYRVVHSEGDLLPGLTVDRFGDALSVQFGTIGIKRFEATILDQLTERLEPSFIIDRTPLRSAQLEGFECQPGAMLRAASEVSAGPEELRLGFKELGMDYELPLSLSQKTGFYADQRSLREIVAGLAEGKSVLDAYSYVGSFGLLAAARGATRVVCVDTSQPALDVGRELAARQGFTQVEFRQADAMKTLRTLGESREEQFDIVICDPPKIAPNRRTKRNAEQLLRQLAREGCRVVGPGGWLVLCSCSARLGIDALTRALALGAREAERSAWIVERVHQAPDHPTLASFPEGLYLSSLVARLD